MCKLNTLYSVNRNPHNINNHILEAHFCLVSSNLLLIVSPTSVYEVYYM